MIDNDPYEQAADWLDDAGTWDAARRAGFLDWLARDAAHVEAAHAVARIMNDPSITQALQNLPAFPANDVQTEYAGPKRHGWMAVAASLGVFALGLGAWQSLRPAEQAVHLATRLNEGAVSRLPDGSTVHLDPASELDVQILGSARRLHLAQGRALFDVAHDGKRPFTVDSGPMAVTAIGTVFSVDNSPAGQGLRVEQGRVRVEMEGLDRPLLIGAGQGVMLDKANRLNRFTFHPDPAMAGNPQWLVVDNERLDSLVARLQRHSVAPLDIAPSLTDRLISGRYKAQDPVASLRLIALAHGWRVQAVGTGWRLAP